MAQQKGIRFELFTEDRGMIHVVVSREKLDKNGLKTKSKVLFFSRESGWKHSTTDNQPISCYLAHQDFMPGAIDDIVGWFDSFRPTIGETYEELLISFESFLVRLNSRDDPETIAIGIESEIFHFRTADLGFISVVIGEIGDQLNQNCGVRFARIGEESEPAKALCTYWAWHAIPSGEVEDALPWLKTYEPDENDTFDDIIESFELFLSNLFNPELNPGIIENRFQIKVEQKPLLQSDICETPTRTITIAPPAKNLPSHLFLKSSVSGRITSQEFLIQSDKNPNRYGLIEETIRCEVTGKRLLIDEVGVSSISGKNIDIDLLIKSSASDLRALESEMLICEESGELILPCEGGQCAVTGKKVDKRHLVKSDFTDAFGLKSKSTHCEFSGKLALLDEINISAVSGKKCFYGDLRSSAVSGAKAHPSEMVTCSHTGHLILPSEATRSSLSGRVVRLDVAVFSDRAPNRVGLPSEIIYCSVSGARLLADEVVKSDFSSKWVNANIAAKSSLSGKICLPDELVQCEISKARLLPDEIGKCTISGKLVDPRILVASEISGRYAIPSQVVRCELSGKTVLADEAERSTVSGRLCRKDLLVQSELKPLQLGLPDEIRLCTLTGKRIFVDEITISTLPEDLAYSLSVTRSEISSRNHLQNELMVCEESGAKIPLDETAICAITGRRVAINFLVRSDFSQRLGLSRFLANCPETLRAGFPGELEKCEVTGRFVDPEKLNICAESGKRMLQRLMVQCAISFLWIDRELATRSTKSLRWAKSEFKTTCHWSGQVLLQDEMDICRITGVSLDMKLIIPERGAAPIIELISKGHPIRLDMNLQANSIRAVLTKSGIKTRAMTIQLSPDGTCAAYYVDCSGFFGLRKRCAVGFISLGKQAELLGSPSIGLQINSNWVPNF